MWQWHTQSIENEAEKKEFPSKVQLRNILVAKNETTKYKANRLKAAKLLIVLSL